MPRVAIVVPSYNHARFLPDCLESVRAQTFADWNLRLIDDGSRDESVEIAREFARKDPRITVAVNEANRGTYGTQQRGLDETDAPLVAVLNSDDRWGPTKLEHQVALLDRVPAAPFCYVLGSLIDAGGRPLADEDVHDGWPRDEIQEPLPCLLYENRVLASGVLFRRPGLRFETRCRYSGDWVALLERAVVGPAVCVPEPLTFWRQHGHNTYTASPRQMAEEIRVREAIARRAAAFPTSRGGGAALRSGLGWNALNLLALRAFFHDAPGVRKAGLDALRHGNRPALKRTVGALLGVERLRRRLWPALCGGQGDPGPEALRRILDESPAVDLRLGTDETDGL